LSRNTVRAALRSSEPPAFKCPERPSKLDPFKDEIHRLLKDAPRLTGVRVRELIEPLGFDGSKTIVDDYLREIRPVFLRLRRHTPTYTSVRQASRWMSRAAPGELWAAMNRRPMSRPPERRHHLTPYPAQAYSADKR
jgi:hypothetical protein